MIGLTKLNGQETALNVDLIERVEATPDTVVTLVDGSRYLVAESVQEVVDKARDYRAGVLAATRRLEAGAGPRPVLRALTGGHE